MFSEPSPQTYRSIDPCRKEFANTKGVTKNAIDQLLAGNTKDPYPPFRSHFKDVCATREADPDVYLNDLLTIKQQFRPSEGLTFCEAFMKKLEKAHDLIETGTRAVADGQLDKNECVELLNKIGKAETALNELKLSVIHRKNVLSGAILPDEVMEKVQARTNGAK